MNELPESIVKRCKDIKLIFFDIDGTLLNADGQWSKTLESEIHRLHQQGVKLAIASGRPRFAAQFIFDVLPIRDAGLFCTGAEIYDPSQHKSIQTHSLNNKSVIKLYEKAESLKVYSEFYTSEQFFVTQRTPLTDIHAAHLRVQPNELPFSTIMASERHFTKLLLANDEQMHPGQLNDLAEAFPEFEFAFANFLAYPGWRFASVISNKASKQLAFDQLLNYHQLSGHEVAAFGDSHSDEVFIELAGLGVAMGASTSEALKQKADFVTRNVDQGGLEIVLSSIASA